MFNSIMLYNSFTKKWDISLAASVQKLVFKPNRHVVTLQKGKLYISLIHTIRTLNYWISDKFTIKKAVNAGLSVCLFVCSRVKIRCDPQGSSLPLPDNRNCICRVPQGHEFLLCLCRGILGAGTGWTI